MTVLLKYVKILWVIHQTRIFCNNAVERLKYYNKGNYQKKATNERNFIYCVLILKKLNQHVNSVASKQLY